MTDHAAPPCGPDRLDLGIPRSKNGLLQPTEWGQLWKLWLGVLMKTIQYEPVDLSKLPETISADDIVIAEPHMAKASKWWEETKRETAAKFGLPVEYLFPDVDADSKKRFIDAIFNDDGDPELRQEIRDGQSVLPQKKELPLWLSCNDESMPEECCEPEPEPKKCEHGKLADSCPWPPDQCEHAGLDEWYAEMKESFPHRSSVFGPRYVCPKVKLRRIEVSHGWSWSVIGMARPKEDPITGEVTWEDDLSTFRNE